MLPGSTTLSQDFINPKLSLHQSYEISTHHLWWTKKFHLFLVQSFIVLIFQPFLLLVLTTWTRFLVFSLDFGIMKSWVIQGGVSFTWQSIWGPMVPHKVAFSHGHQHWVRSRYWLWIGVACVRIVERLWSISCVCSIWSILNYTKDDSSNATFLARKVP